MSGKLICSGALTALGNIADGEFQSCVTSPPYWGLRDYGVAGQIGRETTVMGYITNLTTVLAEVRRTLRADGALWLNVGDVYARQPMPEIGVMAGELVGIPWLLALSLRGDGWRIRSEIIWDKINPMPGSVKSRPTRVHESLFLLTKTKEYFYDADSIREPHLGIERVNFDGKRNCLPKSSVPGQSAQRDRAGNHPLGRNARTIWPIPTAHFSGAHFAVFPAEIPRRCILATSRVGDRVLDPFCGSGTTCLVAQTLGRQYLGIDISSASIAIAASRLEGVGKGKTAQIAEPLSAPAKDETDATE